MSLILPGDEVRTLTWIENVAGQPTHCSVRYHIPKPQPGETFLQTMDRAFAPSITVDGIEAKAFAHFAVFEKYLHIDEIRNHTEAMKRSLGPG